MKRTRSTRSSAAADGPDAPLGGRPDLTPDAYWAADGGRAKRGFGVLEVNTAMAGCDARHLYVRSVFWGLSSELAAHGLAVKGNAVRASYVSKREQRTRFLVAHAHPDVRPWFEADGKRWRLPRTLELAHQVAVFNELLAFFTDTYLPTVAKRDRAEEHQVFACLAKELRTAADALPAAFWALRPGVFAERIDGDSDGEAATKKEATQPLPSGTRAADEQQEEQEEPS